MRIGPQRPVNPDAIVAPSGYRVEALVTGLTFPSAISFGPGGELYLAESGGVAGRVVAVPRVLRIDPDRSVNEIGRLENPIMGLVYRAGELLIGEDGPSPRVLRVTAEGEVKILVEGLPGGGDYGLSGLSLDASGALLFGLGTRTNSGVVGLDNLARGWVARNPEWADVPGAEVRLAGINYVTQQPTSGGAVRQITGGFKPFGRRSQPGEAVQSAARCNGAVYRLALDGAEPERLAWGLRNPLGLAVTPEGRLLATEGGMEERGSRPIAGAPDNLWEVRPNTWYGWPDFASGQPVDDARFRLPGHPLPRRLSQNAPEPGVAPVATFAPRSGIGRVDVSFAEEFGLVGQALVALSGEWSAATYPGEEGPGGYRVVSVDLATGQATDFLVNRQRGPASGSNSGGLERPFDVRFDPTGEVLYVVDMGEVNLSRELGLEPYGGTGVVWRISRTRTMVTAPGPRQGNRQQVSPVYEPTVTEAPEDDEEETEETAAPEQLDEAEESAPVTEAPIETAAEPATEETPADEQPESEGAGLAGETLSGGTLGESELSSSEPGVSSGAGLSLEPIASEQSAEAVEAAAPETAEAGPLDDIAEGSPEAHPTEPAASEAVETVEEAPETPEAPSEPEVAAGEESAPDETGSEVPQPEEPVAEEPAAEEPAAEEPSNEVSGGEEPASEAPASEAPAEETPAEEAASGEEPAGEEAASEAGDEAPAAEQQSETAGGE